MKIFLPANRSENSIRFARRRGNRFLAIRNISPEATLEIGRSIVLPPGQQVFFETRRTQLRIVGKAEFEITIVEAKIPLNELLG